MTTETTVRSTANSRSTGWLIVKVALTLLVLVELAGIMFNFFYILLAHREVQFLLASAQLTNVLDLESRLLGMTLAPLAYAILAALSPLIGWWIYSRVDKPQQSAVGWGSASLFAFTYVGIGLLNAGAMARLGMAMSAISTILGLAIIILYVMLFMTIGFITAAITRVKL